MTERIIKANGIEIWTEDFGEASHIPILLIMGATAQGIRWPTPFCQQLADKNRYVIRYDHRDTGQSSCFDYAETPYTLADMADDAVGVLDAYDIAKAHIVGLSMGGMIGQIMAIEHPDRIHSLVSISSSPANGSQAVAITGFEPLPPPTPKYHEVIRAWALDPPQTREEHIALQLRLFRALTGTLRTGI
jgi:pimeloyl-ACP methyl ester carboxylesterase